jgi:hypothetical protein
VLSRGVSYISHLVPGEPIIRRGIFIVCIVVQANKSPHISPILPIFFPIDGNTFGEPIISGSKIIKNILKN